MDYLALTLPGGKNVDPPGQLPSGGLETFSDALGVGINIMLLIAVFASLIFLVLGGLQWTSSGGDKGKVAAARAKLTYAIIGLVVALSSFLIINLFGAFFGVEFFGN